MNASASLNNQSWVMWDGAGVCDHEEPGVWAPHVAEPVSLGKQSRGRDGRTGPHAPSCAPLKFELVYHPSIMPSGKECCRYTTQLWLLTASPVAKVCPNPLTNRKWEELDTVRSTVGTGSQWEGRNQMVWCGTDSLLLE